MFFENVRGVASVLFLAITCICALAQITTTQTSRAQLLPPADWLKEGVCIVYQTQGGTRVMKGGDASAFSTVGYLIYIVTNVEGDEVYGLEYKFDLNPARGTYSFRWNAKLLNVPWSFIYFPLDQLAKILKEKETYAYQGVSVEGGSIGGGQYYFAMTRQSVDERVVTTYTFREDGLIVKSTYTGQSPTSADAFSNTLIGVYQLRLPSVSLPPVANRSANYDAYRSTFGIVTPLGQLSLTPVGVLGRVVKYKATTLSGLTTTETYGTHIIGPHYVHPELLKLREFLTVSEIGFKHAVTGTGPNGGVVVTIYVGNWPVAAGEYDPRTGLLLSFQRSDMDSAEFYLLVGH